MKIRCVDSKGNDGYTSGKIYDYIPKIGFLNDYGKNVWNLTNCFDEFQSFSSCKWEIVEEEASECEQVYDNAVSLRKKVEELKAEVEKTKELADKYLKERNDLKNQNECIRTELKNANIRTDSKDNKIQEKDKTISYMKNELKEKSERIKQLEKHIVDLENYIQRSIPKL